jgi:phage terminase large subunit
MSKRKSPQFKTAGEQRFAAAVKAAGVQADQLTNFLRAGYVPQPKQLQFHGACRAADAIDGPDQIGFGGARGPGKSHAVFTQIALDDCQRIPGMKVLFIRKVAKNAREQFQDLRRTVLRNVQHDYAQHSGLVVFPNGSRIIIGHFRNESDVDQYLGLEYDIIAIEEATTLTLSKYKTLRDSNRTSKPDFRPRIYSSTNPGNIGHVWYKDRFITPARRGEEKETRFIFATVEDNRLIDKGYKAKLEDNTGWKLAAYRFGDWDIAAGQYFSTWNYDLHTCKPFDVPGHWPIWGAFDYGFTHPTAFYLLTENDGKIYVIAEHCEAKALPAHHAAEMGRLAAKFGREIGAIDVFAGPDVFANKGDEHAKTIAMQYEEQGIRLSTAPNDRVTGWSELLRLLGDPLREDRPLPAQIQVFRDCVKLIECLPSLQHNPNKPEDILKWDVDEEGLGGDDSADALRYGLMARLIEAQEYATAGNRHQLGA